MEAYVSEGDVRSSRCPFGLGTLLGSSVVSCLYRTQVCSVDSQHVFHIVLLLCHPCVLTLHWCCVFSASELVTPRQVLNLLEQSFTAELGDTVYLKLVWLLAFWIL